jgi:hypothetical protein
MINFGFYRNEAFFVSTHRLEVDALCSVSER